MTHPLFKLGLFVERVASSASLIRYLGNKHCCYHFGYVTVYLLVNMCGIPKENNGLAIKLRLCFSRFSDNGRIALSPPSMPWLSDRLFAMSITVFLAISKIVFLPVRHQVLQGESIVISNVVNGEVGVASWQRCMSLDPIKRAVNSLR